MGKGSLIEWTTIVQPDGTRIPGGTQNFWIGCRKVSPACTNCYAGTLVENRMGKPFYPAQAQLGRVAVDADSPVWRTKTWGEPLKWQKEAAALGETRRVFTCSLSDFFLDHPSVHEWRREAWRIIRDTPNLLWLVLSKRWDLGEAYIRGCLPDDWGDGYPNVMLGATVENQETTSRLEVACRIPSQRGIFASCEPLLGAIDLRPYFGARWRSPVRWVIGGGESGSKSRPMAPAWALDLRDQAMNAGVDYHFKQWGEHTPYASPGRCAAAVMVPGPTWMYRVGKKAAGRLLDGRNWDGGPV